MSRSTSAKLKECLSFIHSQYRIMADKKQTAILNEKKDNGHTCHTCKHCLVNIKRCKKKNKFLLSLHRICNDHELKRTPSTENKQNNRTTFEEAYEQTDSFPKDST